MKAATGVLLILGLLSRAFSAPVDINVDKKGGQRVSTKEILNLEQQLKAQAGEDKKFYPSDIQKQTKFVPPQQKVDGLEPPLVEDKEVLQNAQSGELPPPILSQAKPEETDSESEALVKDDDLMEEAEAIPSQFDLAEQDELDAEKRHDLDNLDALDHELMNERDLGYSSDVNDVGNDDVQRYFTEGAYGDRNGKMDEAEEEGKEEEEEEALFMQSVMEALRDRPELLQQFLQAERLENDAPNDVIVPQNEDEADREAVVKAELMEEAGGRGRSEWPNDDFVPSQLQEAERIREEAVARSLQERKEEEERALAQQGLPSLEDYQKYLGDSWAKVVKKNYNPYHLPPPESNVEEEQEHNSNEKFSTESSEEESNKSNDSNLNAQKYESSKESSDSSEETKEGKVVSNEQKRIDMSQHLAM